MADRELDHEQAPEDEEEDSEAEERYKRRVAISLAVLAVLGAWIAILQTNASTNEGRLAREATRLASGAQAATVVELGALSALEQADAQIDALPLQPGFTIDERAAGEVGIEVDPERRTSRLENAQDEVLSALADDQSALFEVQVEARRLTLENATVVEQRTTWNARASQYETVLTVLAVALFLVGFTLVVSRKLRPPFALPGLLLALFCLGWALHIYNKPIPDVPGGAIDATAEGEADFDNASTEAAAELFTTAIELDDEYRPPYEGRALANLVTSNPDILRTLAITDTTSPLFDQAVSDARTALDLGGDRDVVALTIAGLLTLAEGEYDLAAGFLEDAVELNDLTPGLQLSLSAIEIARGDEDAARGWRERAVGQLGAAEESDYVRGLAAQYHTLLELVAERVPERADLAEELARETIRAETGLATGAELTGEVPAEAGFEVAEVRHVDGTTVVDLMPVGLETDTTVTVVGYERPAEGATWVQPAELFYAGAPGTGDGALEVESPRACEPVEYRFDLYVEGVFVERVTAPGGEPTC